MRLTRTEAAAIAWQRGAVTGAGYRRNRRRSDLRRNWRRLQRLGAPERWLRLRDWRGLQEVFSQRSFDIGDKLAENWSTLRVAATGSACAPGLTWRNGFGMRRDCDRHRSVVLALRRA